MSNTKVKVTFTDIEVINDGDKIGQGEVYWSLKVDGSVLSSRSVANPYKIGSGGTIQLGNSVTVTKANSAGTNLVVSGSVSEKDSGKDESDSFTHTYWLPDFGTGSQSVNLADKKFNVKVNYIIAHV
ncbi:MAG: hypothetical protein R2911_26245 [Caldilineaceae bacterium]